MKTFIKQTKRTEMSFLHPTTYKSTMSICSLKLGFQIVTLPLSKTQAGTLHKWTVLMGNRTKPLRLRVKQEAMTSLLVRTTLIRLKTDKRRTPIIATCICHLGKRVTKRAKRKIQSRSKSSIQMPKDSFHPNKTTFTSSKRAVTSLKTTKIRLKMTTQRAQLLKR